MTKEHSKSSGSSEGPDDDDKVNVTHSFTTTTTSSVGFGTSRSEPDSDGVSHNEATSYTYGGPPEYMAQVKAIEERVRAEAEKADPAMSEAEIQAKIHEEVGKWQDENRGPAP